MIILCLTSKRASSSESDQHKLLMRIRIVAINNFVGIFEFLELNWFQIRIYDFWMQKGKIKKVTMMCLKELHKDDFKAGIPAVMHNFDLLN
jgi:hypothetical protein